MSEDEDRKEEEVSFVDILNFQNDKTGKLLDYNQQIVLACRQQALNWQQIAQAYLRCADTATEIAESCAIAARISSDRVGDVISNEFSIEIDFDDDDLEDDDDDDND